MTRFKGYRFLLGPEQLSMGDSGHVDSPAMYRIWHTTTIHSRGGNAWDAGRQAIARVNHGRWIADCAWCAGGMLTRPSWGVAYCAECGARYERGTYPNAHAVVFPEAYAVIEKLLLRRVRRDQQNWDARQSFDELQAENERAEVLTP